ncbi:Mur ligase [Alcaligenes sp. 1735tsa3]|uniref:Mur ligase n=1 Tax=Alcaligenes sp. 1735tsa3 TaxID=2953809 RepID=UPI0020A81E0B|nr:Mur ligase [Alcaligenes sp. 1735tsa3]USY27202.1 Mur ligase [Alcaligenes sp. 1735tsa3]
MMKYDMDVQDNAVAGADLIAFETRLASLKAALTGKFSLLDAPFPAVTLVFAVSDGTARAVTAQGSGADLDAAWDLATAALKKIMARRKLRGRFLRVDWVEKAETWTWDLLRKRLREVKRNYCRKGIALDRSFSRLFLEMEINAQAMLYGGNQVSHCVLNENNFQLAAQQKYGVGTTVDFQGDGEVYILETAGLFCGEDGIVHELYGNGRNAGRRKIESLDDETLADIIRNSSDFLARQVDKEGRFVYGYHPCFNRQIPAYNALRHASTTYSMLEAWEKTRQPELLAAIERALDYLTTQFIRDCDDKAFVVDTGNEIKLGANATAILAMTKYNAVLGSDRFTALMEKLALGILHMQAQDGSFTHVLTWPSLEVKEKFRIVYYEGEAAFALMRLYSLTKDERWIGAVERAFGHFIEKDYWKHHDHWLSYCTNELTLYRPELRYFRFGIQNFEGYLDFVLQRITTFPTLLELMMAGRKMLDRLKAMPNGADILAGLDEARFDQALHFRAAYLLNGHFWPEYAMFFRNPDQILGSFFIRHHAFRVRIDDVEHYLSGLVAYAGLLEARASGDAV